MCFMRVWWTLWGDFGVHSGNTPDLDMIFGYEIKYSALQHLRIDDWRCYVCSVGVLGATLGAYWALMGIFLEIKDPDRVTGLETNRIA
jgi:hypothetical protein